MKKKHLNKGVLTENSAGIGPVTREMVHMRTRELAVEAGRAPPQVSQVDYEQAKRELTGESDTDRQEAMLNSIPETERWDPVPGSAGHQTPEAPSEDEDAEGRSATEQLVDKGAEEAGRDRKLRAARPAGKKNRRAP